MDFFMLFVIPAGKIAEAGESFVICAECRLSTAARFREQKGGGERS
jgi:hypothetical protein